MSIIRVLVVEDSTDLREEVIDYLRFRGFTVEGAATVAEMRAWLWRENGTGQILVLDLGLPDGDGLAAAEHLRKQHGLTMGIIMMTALGEPENWIAGLTAGADAYLVKPVNLRELEALIRRLALRLPDVAPPATMSAGWRLDAKQLQLHAPNGVAVALTGAESRILAHLMAMPGEPLRREWLCQQLAPTVPQEQTRRLDTLLSRLRAKVEEQTRMAPPIQTFRNLGYAFTGTVRSEGVAP